MRQSQNHSTKSISVLLFGLGRIGLPLALVLAEKGFRVLGIDKNEKVVKTLLSKKEPFQEPGLVKLLLKHSNKNFLAYSYRYFAKNTRQFQKVKFVIMAVGLNLGQKTRKPDFAVLNQLTEDLLKLGLKNKTIILRTTVPLGTTDVLKQRLEKASGLKEGRDFYLVFVPERLAEGKAVDEELTLPKIIGAYSDAGFSRAKTLFSRVGGALIRVSQPKTAEFVKLIDNSWRNLIFAFANDLSAMAQEHSLDVLEAIEAANQGYSRNNVPLPGPVSGYCLWKDPLIFEYSFKKITQQRGFPSLSLSGRYVNNWLFQYVADKIKKGNVLVVGLSYKKDVDDYRFSHGLEIIKKLQQKGCQVRVMDPYLNQNLYTQLPENVKVKACHTLNEALDDIDAVVLATNHRVYGLSFARRMLRCLSASKKVLVIDLWREWSVLAKNKNIIYRSL